MSDQADQAITALRTGHDELATLVGSMTPDDLTQPSAAAEWDISQVLSHLGSGAEIGLATLETALEAAGNLDPEFVAHHAAHQRHHHPRRPATSLPRLLTRVRSLSGC